MIVLINDQEYDIDPEEDVKVNSSDLDGDFCSFPSQYHNYASLYEEASDQERRLKVELARMGARLDPEARRHLAEANIRESQAKVDSWVTTHKLYVEIHDELLDVQRTVGLLKAARDAMLSKKDALVSLGANRRKELDAFPSIRQ
jgi:hypothetical protein